MTLVEVLVAVTLIIIIMIPFGTVFYTTVGAATSNANQQMAASLATSVVSGVEATPYGQVGLAPTYSPPSSYVAAPWVQSKFRTLRSGQVGPTFTVSGSAFAPIMTNVAAGTRTFTVTTHFVWASSALPACPGYTGGTPTAVANAYVEVLVDVTWTNGKSGAGQLQQSTMIYPGGRPAYTGSSDTAPAVPTPVTATVSTTAGSGISVTWPLPTSPPWTATGAATGPTSCFAVGWARPDQLTVGSALMTSGTPSWTAGTATYTIPGAVLTSGLTYAVFVDAYSPDGVVSVQSPDARSVVAP